MLSKLDKQFGSDGWILSLKDRPDSVWGEVEEFYVDMEKSGTVAIADWEGSFRGDALGPQVGQGIAFYHNTRAKFPSRDPFKKEPRISLIGKLIEVDNDGKKCMRTVAKYQKSVLRALHKSPIVSKDSTKQLFEKCGIVQGSIASYYYAPPTIWKQFLTLLGKRM